MLSIVLFSIKYKATPNKVDKIKGIIEIPLLVFVLISFAKYGTHPKINPIKTY